MQSRFDLSNLSMVYLVGVVLSAIAFGRRAAMLAALLSVAAFDFLFVPPRYTLRVSDTQYLVTLGVMLFVAAVIGTLTAWLRGQLVEARLRERRTAALFRLSHDLAVRSTARDVLEAAVVRIAEALGGRAAVLLPGGDGRLGHAAGDALAHDEDPRSAQRAYDEGQIIGLDAGVASGPQPLYLPLQASAGVLGVLAIRAADARALLDPERLQLARALAGQTALALERCRLGDQAQEARTQAETERARSALLSSVSHDLRTPLAAITGAASGLRDDRGSLSEATRHELAETISEQAQRLNRLIGNLLDMTRLESNTLLVRKEWHSLEEVVGAALARLEATLGDRPIRLEIPADLPLVPLDDVLFEQVIANLIDNADKYSPPGLPIDVRASIVGGTLRVEVADRGPGLCAGEERRVFEKFYRGAAALGRPGSGLGLAICQGIAAAHSGAIAVAARAGGGAAFTVSLPLAGEPPVVEREGAEVPPVEAPPADAAPARSAP